MLTIKLSDDYLAKLGAANTSEFSARLDSLLSEVTTLRTFKTEADQKLEGANSMNEQLTALLARVDALDAKISALPNFESLKTEAVSAAKSEASRVVGEAFAATGTKPAGANPNQGTNAPEKPAESDFQGRWNAMTEDDRAEYGGNQKTFEAYEKARLGGKFKHFVRK